MRSRSCTGTSLAKLHHSARSRMSLQNYRLCGNSLWQRLLILSLRGRQPIITKSKCKLHVPASFRNSDSDIFFFKYKRALLFCITRQMVRFDMTNIYFESFCLMSILLSLCILLKITGLQYNDDDV